MSVVMRRHEILLLVAVADLCCMHADHNSRLRSHDHPGLFGSELRLPLQFYWSCSGHSVGVHRVLCWTCHCCSDDHELPKEVEVLQQGLLTVIYSGNDLEEYTELHCVLPAHPNNLVLGTQLVSTVVSAYFVFYVLQWYSNGIRTVRAGTGNEEYLSL